MLLWIARALGIKFSIGLSADGRHLTPSLSNLKQFQLACLLFARVRVALSCTFVATYFGTLARCEGKCLAGHGFRRGPDVAIVPQMGSQTTVARTFSPIPTRL